MIAPSLIFDTFKNNNITFYCGVPDSLLKNLCAYITDHTDRNHIITANEGEAIALACGHYIATGNPAVVYMQNSGEGNAINPLLSLADPEVYAIPLIMLIGWRGEPGIQDEPQHVKQGKVTCTLLETLNIPYCQLSTAENIAKNQIEEIISSATQLKRPHAIIIHKDTFQTYSLSSAIPSKYELTREQAISCIIENIPQNAFCVSTTGMASRELYELREKRHQDHKKDFLTVGSMGYASQIALGIAIQKQEKKIYCIDGDGAILMHMGNMAITGNYGTGNLIHIVINNGAHDSVGGQPTVAQKINLCSIASSCGYEFVTTVETQESLIRVLRQIETTQMHKPAFLEIKVAKGARKDLGRPQNTPQENLQLFMEALND